MDCTHCGQCCLSTTCALGQVIFLVKEDEICPAIEIEEGLYHCGLVCNTSYYVSKLVGNEKWKIGFMNELFKKLIGIGEGCTNGQRTRQEHRCNKTFREIIDSILVEKE